MIIYFTGIKSVDFVMTHGDVVVESTLRDHVLATQVTDILEQPGIVNTFNMIPGSTSALEFFPTDRTRKFRLTRHNEIIFLDKLK